MLDQLDRRFGRFAISNLTLYLIVGQVFVTLATIFRMMDPLRLILVPAVAIHGEPWRFVTWLLIPPPTGGGTLGLIFLPFLWWLLYLMGNALEEYWGAFRYNLFLLVGVVLTVGAGLLTPLSYVSNSYFLLSIGLAFAWLNPDFELALYFVLNVKVKWIALVIWIAYAYQFLMGGLDTKLQIVAASGNFLLFFGRDIRNTMRYRKRRMEASARRAAEEQHGPAPRHRCHICGKTDVTNPEMDFRYCSKCAGDQCYCPEHIFAHEHVLAESDEPKV